VAALVSDLQHESANADGRVIESIFLGGGTPSLFSPAEIDTILDAGRRYFSLSDDCEITMEANPGTVEHGSLAAYREAGINRLSIGAQSFDRESLNLLGRIHGPEEISRTFEEAVHAGFDSINLDLMFALPKQDTEKAAADIEKLLELSPSHVSWYQLTLEPNTVFFSKPPDGIPDDDLAWEIQEQGQRMLFEAGYEQYEISAFAKSGHPCRHNLNYWQFGDYLAAGAGAHGKLTDPGGGSYRYRKPANPLQYIEQAESGRINSVPSRIEESDLGFEFMLNALRLSAGFSARLLTERTGINILTLEGPLRQAVADGLLEEVSAGEWRPTPDGFRFLNDLQARFLP
jgi:oxygen-independent coproporphyrinogen-3 oxidase